MKYYVIYNLYSETVALTVIGPSTEYCLYMNVKLAQHLCKYIPALSPHHLSLNVNALLIIKI